MLLCWSFVLWDVRMTFLVVVDRTNPHLDIVLGWLYFVSTTYRHWCADMSFPGIVSEEISPSNYF